jgi:hypothetical protein
MNFSEHFNLIENCKAKVLLEHIWFERQIHYCEDLHIINDDRRIGLILKGQEIFISKQNLICTKKYDNMFVIADDKLKITIIVNKM